MFSTITAALPDFQFLLSQIYQRLVSVSLSRRQRKVNNSDSLENLAGM
jgi:hypothetical protein